MNEPLSLGALKARAHLTQLREQHDAAKDGGLPEYGVVTSVSGNLVACRVADDTGAGGQLFAKAALPVSVGAVGLLFPIKGGSKVFLPVGAPAFPVGIKGLSNNALLVEDSTGLDIFNVDTILKEIGVGNGADIVGYSDGGATETFRIDAATGAATFGSTNSPYLYFYSDLTTDTTTNTSTWVDKLATSGLVLPTGTWEVRVAFWARIGHSANPGTVDARAVIDGNVGATVSQPAISTLSYPIFGQAVQSGIASGSRTLKVQFKGTTVGTSSIGDVIMLTYFRRTA